MSNERFYPEMADYFGQPEPGDTYFGQTRWTDGGSNIVTVALVVEKLKIG